MRKATPAASPDSYVAALSGWRHRLVTQLRAAVRQAAAFEEVVKWGHLVYLANGPAVLVRAEEERVLLGFWRGRRLRAIEPALKTGGKYEMASLELRQESAVDPAIVEHLALEAASLNRALGDPTQVTRRT